MASNLNKVCREARGIIMTPKKSRQTVIEQAARDYHDHNLTDLATLNRTLLTTISAIEEAGIPYALIGGVAVKELGRPRVTHDIDIFVRPDDAAHLLNVLEKKGFVTEKRDTYWLYKAWREEVLVDVIFKSSGDIYFDDEVIHHVRRIPYLNTFINAISPEDFIVIKAAAHQEDNPHHWHDALAVLTQGNLDWNYLLHRARHSPRRVLALLLYASSNDVAIPYDAIQKLYRLIHEPSTNVEKPITHPYRQEVTHQFDTPVPSRRLSPIYKKGEIMEAFSCDGRIPEHDLSITISGDTITVRGEVFNTEQLKAIDEVLNEFKDDLEVINQVQVRIISPYEGNSEAIS